jgi:hypothetical protein
VIVGLTGMQDVVFVITGAVLAAAGAIIGILAP